MLVIKVVAGRQVVVDWAMAKARFMDASAQPPGQCLLSLHNCPSHAYSADSYTWGAADKQGAPDAAQLADTLPVDGDAPKLQVIICSLCCVLHTTLVLL